MACHFIDGEAVSSAVSSAQEQPKTENEVRRRAWPSSEVVDQGWPFLKPGPGTSSHHHLGICLAQSKLEREDNAYEGRPCAQ